MKSLLKIILFITLAAALLAADPRVCRAEDGADYIKWAEFNVSADVLQKALSFDVASRENGGAPIDWIDLLAYAAAKNWGDASSSKKMGADICALADRLNAGEKLWDIAGETKLYDYYREVYGAILGGFVGEYEIEERDERGESSWAGKYGLKVYSPIAKGYSFSHYDDFGDGRSYGYRRKHQGNDLMGSLGTPIIAVEDGYVEALGWNRFGGWRVGVRSLDGKRYYYYAHLRKDRPYHSSLYEGKSVRAGDVIGYLGMSGYSSNENVNNIKVPHLHFGIQLIFDESQKDGTNQIWIDAYNIVELLNKNKMSVYKNAETGDYERAVQTRPAYE